MRDLIVLCADQDARLGVQALLTRHSQLGFRKLDFQAVKHNNRDNGVFQDAHNFLRPECNAFSHALAICDFEGCGRERRLPREEIETLIEQHLQSNGWENRAAAIVIAPELEAWVWGDWPALAKEVNWPGGAEALRAWLAARGWIAPEQAMPSRPKESLDRVLRQINRSASSSLFAALGRTADSSSCADPAFRKLLVQLKLWFPPEVT
jgi:hypothetical protein